MPAPARGGRAEGVLDRVHDAALLEVTLMLLLSALLAFVLSQLYLLVTGQPNISGLQTNWGTMALFVAGLLTWSACIQLASGLPDACGLTFSAPSRSLGAAQARALAAGRVIQDEHQRVPGQLCRRYCYAAAGHDHAERGRRRLPRFQRSAWFVPGAILMMGFLEFNPSAPLTKRAGLGAAFESLRANMDHFIHDAGLGPSFRYGSCAGYCYPVIEPS